MARVGGRANAMLLMAAALLSLAVVARGRHLVLPQDTGPDSVDVSAYPPDMQAAYRIFKKRCSQCHTLARPINTTMTPAYWAHYVGVMVDKSPGKFEPEDARRIYEFLAYDQQVRKDAHPEAFYPPLTEEEIRELKAKQGLR